MHFTQKPIAENYPVTPSQWRDFYNASGWIVIPHYKSGRLHYVRVKEAVIPPVKNELNEYAPNFYGETVSLIVTTWSGKEIGIRYCNELPDLDPVKYPVLQVDMNNAITNQRWLKPGK
ncbi:hypothetical protein [Aliikangiella coralliicola]|uniref:Uncharacterized protein n=1 Tax=Aliikangiella coralliicola TaxID=2592383 RepID=A0A545U078_9GAMM|nr:hypothetical protein [Aliikangiella coralliicola]TQV82872.1 hypothetical protein FLL46_24185 [Aliikangiella coralliicola]